MTKPFLQKGYLAPWIPYLVTPKEPMKAEFLNQGTRRGIPNPRYLEVDLELSI
ncbi:MAG: hypothetical protein H0U53_00590 [Actinobacteria bacterium]|nr:hypothetical protein [Actinomycetota bacterium]